MTLPENPHSWLNRNSKPILKDEGSKPFLGADFSSSSSPILGRYIGISASSLIKEMKASLDVNRDKAQRIIELLGDIIQKSDINLEIAEVSYECGIALYQMREYSEATLYLQEAFVKYGRENYHNQAVALWVLGEVYWHRGKFGDAFNHWERSYEIFIKLSKTNIEPEWYVKRSEQLREAIEQRCSTYP